MTIRVCVAGPTGWTGSAVTGAILASSEFQLVGAIARRQVGKDIGEVLGQGRANVNIVAALEAALAVPTDVLIDYTGPDVVKGHILAALDKGVRVVVGTSGLTASDYVDIEQRARERKLGVIAAGNFSITAALAKHFALIAARHLPSWEVIDYAKAEKVDAPSGTVRELAEALGEMTQSKVAVPVEQTHGEKETRGATIGGTQGHSIRPPGYVNAFQTTFGLPAEALTIRHDPRARSAPYLPG